MITVFAKERGVCLELGGYEHRRVVEGAMRSEFGVEVFGSSTERALQRWSQQRKCRKRRKPGEDDRGPRGVTQQPV
ncbi:MAG: hypothetical protein ACI81R_003359 [Bradymonadia bacterium]|jgi:hypothetical protein